MSWLEQMLARVVLVLPLAYCLPPTENRALFASRLIALVLAASTVWPIPKEDA